MIDKKYMYIGIEITNLCNARCPWCFTNKISEGKNPEQSKNIMSVDTFISVFERLENLELINKDVIINLYEIGEPFLNNDISKIIDYLNKKNVKYAISTNASILKLFREKNSLRNLSNLIISVPGFSQESYDRVHGFKFDTIKNNISKMITNFKECGFTGDARIVYHVYQFNLDELRAAKAFAEENGIDVYPYFAILYEWKHVRSYLTNTLPYDLLKKASQELFLGNIERTILNRSPDFSCEFFNMLLIDVDGNLKTCCQIKKGDPNYSFGNIFNLSKEEILTKRTDQPICIECKNRGMDYYLSVYTPFNSYANTNANACVQSDAYEVLSEVMHKSTEKEIVLFGAGKFGTKVIEYMNKKNIKVMFFSDNNLLKIGKTLCGVEIIAPSEIMSRCVNPLVIVTTINHKQVVEQLSQLGIQNIHYIPLDTYTL